jgi:murein DD-endopeptidase MepM/ murein hydrolase activator NlpD
MDSRDTIFRQYINDVESNRRRLAGIRNRIVTPQIEETASHLTIYQYTLNSGDDLFSVAARCNIPYSALASINRIAHVTALEEGQTILLPSFPGLYIPENYQSEIEKLLAASRLAHEESVDIKVNRGGRTETFHFFPGADFTPTERTFFLNAGMRFPLRYFRITSRFGVRSNPVTGNILMHHGMDLAAPEGTEVYAIADGTVTEIGNDPVYGIYIIITHRDRLTSLYGHLQKTETTLNTTVRSGTLIGRVGTTGQSTGPHLHFELRQNGRPIDPARRLRN